MANEDRRHADDGFKSEVLTRLNHLERTLFDEDGNSHIKTAQAQQASLHNENKTRFLSLEGAVNNLQTGIISIQSNIAELYPVIMGLRAAKTTGHVAAAFAKFGANAGKTAILFLALIGFVVALLNGQKFADALYTVLTTLGMGK